MLNKVVAIASVSLVILGILAYGLYAFTSFTPLPKAPQAASSSIVLSASRSNQNYPKSEIIVSGATTGKNYMCSATLRHSVVSLLNTKIITIGGVDTKRAQQFCTTQVAASFFAKLPDVAGKTNIIFTHNGKIDRYRLTVSPEQVSLTPVHATFSSTLASETTSLPNNILAAHCFYNGDTAKDPRDNYCQNFYSEVLSLGEPYMLADENGKQPTVQFYLYKGSAKELEVLVTRYKKADYYIVLETAQYTVRCFADGACRIGGQTNFPELTVKYREVANPVPVTPSPIVFDEKTLIDAWIIANGLNEYGDTKDTMYTGGTPLFNETTGKTLSRDEYIRSRHPDRPWEALVHSQ
jgi:hypothetical protein